MADQAAVPTATVAVKKEEELGDKLKDWEWEYVAATVGVPFKEPMWYCYPPTPAHQPGDILWLCFTVEGTLRQIHMINNNHQDMHIDVGEAALVVEDDELRVVIDRKTKLVMTALRFDPNSTCCVPCCSPWHHVEMTWDFGTRIVPFIDQVEQQFHECNRSVPHMN